MQTQPHLSQHPYRGLTRAEQGHIMRQCVTLARLLSLEGVSPPLMPRALERLRDDLIAAYRAGLPIVSVEWDAYLAPYRGSAAQQAIEEEGEGSRKHGTDHD